ncbi:MAG: DUF3107 domain-containing protein [Actinomycetes bacterium]|jgi:Protein of unknown function (DUF3107)|uniref:Unannotated protein n=1 Tax=freshwater metagenome TaxID=449393 RepID=A0A6J7M6R8_9ZZZZ|nr:DUF3107 domain-containing protein [Actinomycetota bacterium]MSW08217.1 DUF3107 family protein [Actinomycetota bacterium]MSW23761.1 DUF3107 family protein [Actinomycetota bacterium]MSW75098.1 DUF3107 family protein [Actinomycetota bacterium]MSY30475.1 DUF3107 family protein [Actinomycetota bacterium]
MSTKKSTSNQKVEVRIAVLNVARELSFDCPLSGDEIRQALTTALASQTPLVLNDSRGGQVIVPADKIGFVEIGEQAERRVGFGTL